MEYTKEQIKEWLSAKMDGNIGGEELQKLLQAVIQRKDPSFWEALVEEIVHEKPLTASKEDLQPVLQSVLDSIRRAKEQPGTGRLPEVHFLRRWWVAASVILLLATGGYFWFSSLSSSLSPSSRDPHTSRFSQDIAPGKDGAVLTLADGTQVVLDSLGNGVITTQNATRLLLNNNQLTYLSNADPANSASAVTYNSLTTPKGRQFQITLPDGTRVWLNAASMLRYPTVFAGKERRVEVTGEAYFEVAADKARPFFVKMNDHAEVEVLGTSFNVNAYRDEANISATLLEGSVRASVLSSGWPEQTVVLKPAQQAQIVQQATGSAIMIVQNANTEKVMAWKNGVFDFEGTGLEEAMRQLVRWYDIEVVYEKGIPDIRFFGKISRNVKLSSLIKALEESKVRFRLEGERKLVVLP